MIVVLDASVVVAWLLGDEGEAAERVMAGLDGGVARVPAIWAVEIANALVVAERRGRVTEAQASRAAELVLAIPVRVAEVGEARTLRELRLLARLHGLAAYDASYLDLALAERLPLATLDVRLAAAAQSAGVELVL